MPSKFKLVYAAILAMFAVNDIRTRIKSVKLARFYVASIKEYEESHDRQQAVIEYLTYLLERNEIDVDQFDLIAQTFYLD